MAFTEEVKMRLKKAYYSAHALCDGTIYLGVQTRKPRPTRNGGEPQIDEEGIHQWFLDPVGERPHFNEFGNLLRNVCIATALNTRRIVREKVETRLTQLEAQQGMIQEQLLRIEAKLDELLGREPPG